jgi:hypothetical protein
MFKERYFLPAFFILASNMAYCDDISCGPKYGIRDGLSRKIIIKSHEFDMHEIYFPLKYENENLNHVDAILKNSEGQEGYFPLTFEEKDGMYYTHLGIEPIKVEVFISASYGKTECRYIGRIQLKHNNQIQPTPKSGAAD